MIMEMKVSKARNKVYQNYFGSKNGSGVYQQIINQIRPHDIYIELCAGSGAIAQYKKPAPFETIINDISDKVVQAWKSSTIDIPNCEVLQMDAVEFLKTYEFELFARMNRIVVYIDPPYPMDSRRSNREVYEHEMTDQQHVDLLEAVLKLSGNENIDFLISTYENPIYQKMLKEWNLHTFQAQTRKGLATEFLYMNYSNESGILHQYDYLGTDFIDRQRIKRKIQREVSKLINLPATERQAILNAVLDLA